MGEEISRIGVERFDRHVVYDSLMQWCSGKNSRAGRCPIHVQILNKRIEDDLQISQICRTATLSPLVDKKPFARSWQGWWPNSEAIEVDDLHSRQTSP